MFNKRQNLVQQGRETKTAAGTIGADAMADLNTLMQQVSQLPNGQALLGRIMSLIMSDPNIQAVAQQLGQTKSSLKRRVSGVGAAMAQPQPVAQPAMAQPMAHQQ